MFGKKKNIIEEYKGNEAQARKLFLKDAEKKAKKDYYPTSVSRSLFILFCLTFLPQVGFTQTIALEGSKKLCLNNVVVETVKHRGRIALHVTAVESGRPDNLVVIRDIEFQNGTIEFDVASRPEGKRQNGGHAGVAFHVNADATKYECIYLRPMNGRAKNQIQRNHSTQYVSYPDFPWELLRKSQPGKYESYVDLVSDKWTQVKIEVSGTKARLYVNGAEQPALIVNDLKLGEVKGAIALRVGPTGDAYFSNLRITKTK
jgi:hypothetical protein